MRFADTISDLAYGLRTLRKNPGFTTVAVTMLALGIGANTAIFTAVQHVLLEPLPYAQPDRLVALWEDFSFVGFPNNNLSPADFLDWKKQNTVFEDMAMVKYRSSNLTGDGPPQSILGRAVSPNLFPLLGIRPMLGRTFTEDDLRKQSPVVVLGYSLWQSRFARDRGLIGRTITMDGAPVTVIGVMPASFLYPDRMSVFWVPLIATPKQLGNRFQHNLDATARLKPGVSLEQARTQMSQIAKRLEQEYPASNKRVGAVVLPMRENIVGDMRTPLLILIVASGLVLLIACSNLANLLLARASGRKREMSIRAALGAGSGRLIAQVITESLLLSLAGGALALIVAAWSLKLLEQLIPAGFAPSLSMDGRVLLFTAGLSIATGLLFGIAPAIQNSRVHLNAVLNQTSGRSGTSSRTRRLRDGLVAAEVALAMILLVGAGLMLQTLGRLGSENPGFQPDHLLTVLTMLPRAKYSEDAQRLAYYQSVLEGVRRVPGVVGAGFASDIPFTSIGNTDGFVVEGRPKPIGAEYDALYRETSNGYLQAIGAQLLEGRFYSDDDRPKSLPAVIVNETFKKTFWPNETAIGKRIQLGGEEGTWRTIVGVVADLRERGLLLGMKPAVYLSDYQVKRPASDYLAVRTSGDPLQIVAAVRQVVWSVDPEQPVSRVGTMRDLMTRETASRREAMDLLTAFAGLALLLACLGIYGVLSYAVTQRTQEMGLRIALGAERGGILRMVVTQGLSVAGMGIALGLAGSFALTRALQGLLYGVSPTDPVTFGGVALVLLLTSALACYVPARRAAGVDPIVALRYE